MKKLLTLLFIGLLIVSVNNSKAQTPFRGSLNIGANVPIADFSDVYKTGVSVEAGLFYSLPLIGLDLTLTAGYNGFKFKNEYFTDLVRSNLEVAVRDFAPDWTATDIPVMIGARFKLPVSSIKPYVTGEIGIHVMNFNERFNGSRIIGSSSDPSSFSLSGATESKSKIGFGFAFGAGVEIPIIPKVSIDLGAKYNYNGITYSNSFEVFRNSNSNFINPELKNASYLSVRGGVVLDF